MATASWLDPTTRKERLYEKETIQVIHEMPPSEVNRIRIQMCEFIRQVGNRLNMFKPALSCACVLFSRFYARNGFNDTKPRSWTEEDWATFLPLKRGVTTGLDKRLVAVGCLFLAGKIEDNPKKINDVVRAFHDETMGGPMEENTARHLKALIFQYERILLQDIEFDMIVEAPVAFNQMALLIKYETRKNHQENERPDVIFTLSDLVLEDLTEEGVQMMSCAAAFVDASLNTTLWLQYDAPTIAIGIVWMTAKFFYYAGNESGWWGRLERQFRKLNTKKGYNAESDSEELHSMNAPPFEVLEDIADQMVEYYKSRGVDRVQAPQLPDSNTGAGHTDADSREAVRPYSWRYPSFDTGKSEGESKSWISRDDKVFRCSCRVWKAGESLNIKEEERTCRCLLAYLGGIHERQRVGPRNTGMAEDCATLFSERQSKRQRS